MMQKPQAGAPHRGIVVQTILFQQSRTEGEGTQAFINPVQVMLGERFPVSFDLVILSAVHGAARGRLSCTHVIEADGEEVFRYDHPPTPIAYDGTGVSFRLEMTDLEVAKPCVLVVKTALSNGSKGQDVPLRVVDHAGLQGGNVVRFKG